MKKLPFIIWNSSFSVGVNKMDEQHQYLLDVINDLFFASQKGAPESEIIKLINKMVDYTRFHFSNEEHMLSKVNYPGLDTQKNEHRLFTQKIIEFQDLIVLHKASVNIEILEFLKYWWTSHIKVQDLQYKEYIDEKSKKT